MPFVNSNNAKLFYTETGSGDPIIVLHGGPGADHKYMLNLKSLSKHYRLIFVDQRGNGKSKIKNYNTLTFKYFTSDIDNIRKHLHLQKISIIGHSFGGFVALEYAINYSRHISNMILIDTGFNASQVQIQAPQILSGWGYSKRVSCWAHKFFNGELAFFQVPYAFMVFNKAYTCKTSLKVLIKSLSGKHRLKTVYLWFKKYFSGWDIKDKLKTISASTLIIAGEKDFQFPPNYQREMMSEINGAQITIIENAGHNTPLECPGIVTKSIQKFLQ